MIGATLEEENKWSAGNRSMFCSKRFKHFEVSYREISVPLLSSILYIDMPGQIKMKASAHFLI
jgi:hypothetical protein